MSLQLSLIITPQVNMVAGQAHAPVFKAKLSVCEGLVVTATGSSKKIAKNLAAAEMLQKLKNASPELEGSRQDKKIQKEEEKRGCGGGEALHQLVNSSRDRLAELGGMLFLETLAQEQNFVLTVIEVEAVGERVEVLVQVQALKVFQSPQWILTRLLRSREAQLQQSVLGWGLIMRRPGWHFLRGLTF